ncbi:hypothetical protein AB0L47_10105 [Streptomyces bobili]|uniref:hypothetical protein n=1 Tax=Streptomyces bobili TaxID=67280 RepID=UPI00341EE817
MEHGAAPPRREFTVGGRPRRLLDGRGPREDGRLLVLGEEGGLRPGGRGAVALERRSGRSCWSAWPISSALLRLADAGQGAVGEWTVRLAVIGVGTALLGVALGRLRRRAQDRAPERAAS